MNILVVNAGSSSLKYQFIDMQTEKMLCKGLVERIGIAGTNIKHSRDGQKLEYERNLKNHTEAFREVTKLLTGEAGVIDELSEINAVGHRVLHAAEDFTGSVLIDAEVIKTLEKNVDLGPLHMPPNIACIKAAREVLPNVPMVAVFDTAFHSTMPKKAYMYAIKYEDYEQYKVRRYGFHGTSHQYVSGETTKLLARPNTKIVTCHLGNGSSVSAVVDGKCVDTSMGLTPLEGLMMGTRSGDIDPAVVEFLMDKKKLSAKEMIDYLNKQSGFLGISGFSSDNRDVIREAKAGNSRAQLVFEMNVYRIKKYIGSYAVAMGGLDAVIFTGGIGENSAEVRGAVLSDMEFLGIEFDADKNNALPAGNQELSTKSSRVKVFVIPTNEELVIARETKKLAL